jgi:hypothetical protein
MCGQRAGGDGDAAQEKVWEGETIPLRQSLLHRALARVGLVASYRLVGGRWVVPIVTMNAAPADPERKAEPR